jgi:hypothetical protein
VATLLLSSAAALGITRIKEIPRPSGVTTGPSIDWKAAKTTGCVRSFTDAMKRGKLPIWSSKLVETQMDWFTRGQSSGVYDWKRSKTKCVRTPAAPNKVRRLRVGFLRVRAKIGMAMSASTMTEWLRDRCT